MSLGRTHAEGEDTMDLERNNFLDEIEGKNSLKLSHC